MLKRLTEWRSGTNICRILLIRSYDHLAVHKKFTVVAIFLQYSQNFGLKAECWVDPHHQSSKLLRKHPLVEVRRQLVIEIDNLENISHCGWEIETYGASCSNTSSRSLLLFSSFSSTYSMKGTQSVFIHSSNCATWLLNFAACCLCLWSSCSYFRISFSWYERDNFVSAIVFLHYERSKSVRLYKEERSREKWWRKD